MTNGIVISKLVIEGEYYKRTLEFNRGLNVIEGELYSGKSALLNLINFMFGKKEKLKEKVQVELRKYCDSAIIEVIINEQTLAIERNLWKDSDYVLIYFTNINSKDNFSPRILELDEYYDFLFDKLGIGQFRIMKNKPRSKEKIIDKLSYRDLMRYVYVDQHSLGTNFFMKLHDFSIKNKNKFMFDIIFGFVDYDKENITEELVRITNEIESELRQIEGLRAYLREMKVESKIELGESYKKYEEKINGTMDIKNELISKINKNKTSNDSIYDKTQKVYISLMDKIFDLTESKKDIVLALDSKNSLLYSYEEEIKELKATKEAYELLSIDNHKYKCPICFSEKLYDSRSFLNDASVGELINSIDSKIETVKKVIFTTNKKLEKILKEISLLEEEKSVFEKALNKFQETISAPYIPEIETINKLLRELQRSKDSINENLKIINKIEEKEIHIKELEEKLGKLKEKQAKLKIEETDKKKTLRLLNDNYRNYLKQLKLETTINSCYIDKSNYLPYYNNASVTEHDSGGILVCMQIAYLAAIMNQKIENQNIKHPGFLMFDTLGKYLGTYLQQINAEYTDDVIMDPLTYEQLYRLFINLSTNFQVFIVDNIPHSISKPYIRYSFYHQGIKGLIDMNKNEKKVV